MTNCLRTVDKKVDNPENQSHPRLILWIVDFLVNRRVESSFKSLLAMRSGCMELEA